MELRGDRAGGTRRRVASGTGIMMAMKFMMIMRERRRQVDVRRDRDGSMRGMKDAVVMVRDVGL